jgi:hypothetical protein
MLCSGVDVMEIQKSCVVRKQQRFLFRTGGGNSGGFVEVVVGPEEKRALYVL